MKKAGNKKMPSTAFIEFYNHEAAAAATQLKPKISGLRLKAKLAVDKYAQEKQQRRTFRGVSAIGERPPGCKSVFISNLADDITEDAIREFFAPSCGAIARVHLAKDKKTGAFKRVGYVEFVEEESTTKAIAKNSEMLLKKPIRIEYDRIKGGNNSNNKSSSRSSNNNRKKVFEYNEDSSNADDDDTNINNNATLVVKKNTKITFDDVDDDDKGATASSFAAPEAVAVNDNTNNNDDNNNKEEEKKKTSNSKKEKKNAGVAVVQQKKPAGGDYLASIGF